MKPALRALGVFALLSVLLTWPLALRLRIMDPGDAAYFAWAIGWELRALTHAPLELPHANACHPLRFALGLDEPVLGTALLVLPLRLFSDDAVLLFGVARLMTYWLSAFGVYLLLRELRCGEAAALVGGALFAFSPVRTDQVSHLSVLGTQWLPPLLLFTLRFARGARLRDALCAGAAFALSGYACGYHAVLGLLVLPLPLLVLAWGRWRLWRRAGAGALLALLLLLPLRALHHAALEPLGFARGAQEMRDYSARLESFLATSAWNRVWGEASARFRTGPSNLFPGLAPLLLPAAALVVLRRRGGRPSREAWFLAALAAAGALVAMGPEVRLGERVLVTSPVAAARAALPLFANLRAYARAGIWMALGLSALAGLALERLRARPRVQALVALLALGETLVVPIPLADWARVIDSAAAPPPVYAWLARQPPTAMVELPLLLPGDALRRRPAFHESIYLVRSTHHWQRLANCGAGFEPPGYAELRERLRSFPSRAALDGLRASGVRHVVLHARGFGPNQWKRLERALPELSGELRLAARFDDDSVWELVSTPGTPRSADPRAPGRSAR